MASTEVAKHDRTISELVVEGANLPAQEWKPARVAALMQLLPDQFRDASSAIALMSRAKRSGLDPFIREIHAWRDHRGNLCFHTARDGWVRIAENDPHIQSLSFGVVYDGDTFSYKHEGKNIIVEHSGGLSSEKRIVGAYCVVHRPEGQADHIERRVMADYKHLLGKDNWKNYPEDMILTRVISAAVKFCSPLGAGIYTPDEAAEEGAFDRQAEVQRIDMNASAERLRERLDRMRNGEEEPDELVDETPDAIEVDGSVEDDEGPEDAFQFMCEFCGEMFESKRSRAGHYKAHPDEREAKDSLPDDWHIEPAFLDGDDGAVFEVVNPDGEILDRCESYMGAAAWIDAHTGVPAQASDAEEKLERATDNRTIEKPEREDRPWSAERIRMLVNSHTEISMDDVTDVTGGGAGLETLRPEERKYIGNYLLRLVDERRGVTA